MKMGRYIGSLQSAMTPFSLKMIKWMGSQILHIFPGLMQHQVPQGHNPKIYSEYQLVMVRANEGIKKYVIIIIYQIYGYFPLCLLFLSSFVFLQLIYFFLNFLFSSFCFIFIMFAKYESIQLNSPSLTIISSTHCSFQVTSFHVMAQKQKCLEE